MLMRSKYGQSRTLCRAANGSAHAVAASHTLPENCS